MAREVRLKQGFHGPYAMSRAIIAQWSIHITCRKSNSIGAFTGHTQFSHAAKWNTIITYRKFVWDGTYAVCTVHPMKHYTSIPWTAFVVLHAITNAHIQWKLWPWILLLALVQLKNMTHLGCYFHARIWPHVTLIELLNRHFLDPSQKKW